MATTTPALQLLHDLEKSHERMSKMADELDWNGIGEEWARTQPLLAALRQARLTDLRGADRTEAQRLIRNQLAMQHHISERAHPWLEQLRPLLDSFKAHPLETDAT